ncbi:hypothetical protein DSM106972_060270 [Dulcicalothrix desertica PCC 7102]|uniref:Lipoprotein n=1 Tax=Dulcicalothrix desertica PCC 7102 TaxID=232991 RepID=A0A3S1CH58_9CYAN|nr:hypothetical protein [Dulcicalothrix desertica]RUT02549.1 hypothetical protein DSM106972_060270 [Dulcicalothrix desertica PCC 7102]TWH55236.1 hypothetical protein CAL7102_03357 [Dulcicalothrix desertica PCC 7102]
MFLNSKIAIATLSLLAITSISGFAANAILPQKKQPVITAQASKVTKNTIIPGKQVGAITRKTKRADLVKLFGASKLKDETTRFFGGEAEFPGTVINLGKDRGLTVLWKDKTRTQVRGVMVYDSQWKTPEGIGVGTTVSQLQQKIGKFKMSGLGWDYGGIPQLQGTKIANYQAKLVLRMSVDEKLAQKYEKESLAISGDGVTLSSSNPSLNRLGVNVRQMIVFFD